MFSRSFSVMRSSGVRAGALSFVGVSQLETLDAAQLGAHESANFLLQSGIAGKVEGLGEAHDGRFADARLCRELRDRCKRDRLVVGQHVTREHPLVLRESIGSVIEAANQRRGSTHRKK